MNEQLSHHHFKITKKMFSEWRSPRFGESNPTCLDNVVWDWLIRSRISAYEATEEMKGPSPFDNGPTWCFERFGQSKTITPDGRTIYIGGEHEDHYDPDFYIYNDVVVMNPDDKIQIYGYPRNIFPQTDFHTATLVDDQIIILGNLGYPEECKVGETQVFSLNIKNYEIRKVQTTGENPGWIHDHKAEYKKNKNTIIIRKGKVDFGEEQPLIENIDKWELCLNSKKWKRLTNRNWPRWIAQKRDRKSNNIWRLRSALWHQDVNWKDSHEEDINWLTQEIGREPDLSILKTLYRPNIPHIELPEIEDEYNVYRIEIQGIIVRYVEDMYHILVTVEGCLPSEIIENLKIDLVNKLSELENAKYVIIDIKNA